MFVNKLKAIRSISLAGAGAGAFAGSTRSIMSTRNTMSLMEDLQTNPYYDKYANKIAQMQKSDPDRFVDKIEKRHEQIKNKQSQLENSTKKYSSLAKPKESTSNPAATISEKKLDDVLKVDLIKDKDPGEIEEIWVKYHREKEVITACIPAPTYDKIRERVREYPTFLFPLPRSKGYEFVMSQGIGDEVHFTTLLCYQVHKENAPECLTMVHYKDLAEEKGIVLMKGEYDKNVLSAKEAQCLANQFQMYYGQDHPSKLTLLNCFTKEPSGFKHMDLITEFENIKLG